MRLQRFYASQTPPPAGGGSGLRCVFHVHTSGGCGRTGSYDRHANFYAPTDVAGCRCGALRPTGVRNGLPPYRANPFYAALPNDVPRFTPPGMGQGDDFFDNNRMDKPCSPMTILLRDALPHERAKKRVNPRQTKLCRIMSPSPTFLGWAFTPLCRRLTETLRMRLGQGQAFAGSHPTPFLGSARRSAFALPLFTPAPPARKAAPLLTIAALIS